MPRLPAAFVAAVQAGRFREAATDAELQRRSAEDEDPVARALLVLAAAYYLAGERKVDGAALTIGKAVQFLEQAPRDPYAALLIEHARVALEALHAGSPLPALPLDFSTAR